MPELSPALQEERSRLLLKELDALAERAQEPAADLIRRAAISVAGGVEPRWVGFVIGCSSFCWTGIDKHMAGLAADACRAVWDEGFRELWLKVGWIMMRVGQQAKDIPSS